MKKDMECRIMSFREPKSLVEKLNSMFNTLCGIMTDDVIDTKFTIGIANNGGELDFFYYTNKIFKSVLEQKFSSIYETLDYEDEFDIDSFQESFKENSEYCKLILNDKKNKKRISTADELLTFMSNLLSSMYSKINNEKSVILFTVSPIYSGGEQKEKHKNKFCIKNKTLLNSAKALKFVIDSMSLEESREKKVNNTNTIPQEITTDKYFKFNVGIKIAIHNSTSDSHSRKVKLRNICGVFNQLNFENSFSEKVIKNYNEMFDFEKCDFEITSKELTTMLYLPDEKTLTLIIGRSKCNSLIDKNVPNEGIKIGNLSNNSDVCLACPILTLKDYKTIYICESSYSVKNKKILNSKIIDDLCKPKLLHGNQGCGKSEYMVNYAIEGLKRGIPFIQIDPKYDTQKRLIESIPEQYMENVDFLDLGDLLYPPGLNIFRKRKKDDPTENSLITSSFISYMKKQFSSSWGWNIERMFQMATDTILVNDIATMAEFRWLLEEEDYRIVMIQIIQSMLQDKKVENKSRLKAILKYWLDYQARYEKNPATVSKEIESIMNKIGSFLGNRFISAIISQRETYDFKKSGDMAKSVIVNVPEGIIGPENLSLLCGFVNKAIWMDFQSRDDMEMNERYPVQWIIDEAHTVIDNDFVGILQKARSRRLGLTLTTQTLASFDLRRDFRMSEVIADSCRTKLVFKVGQNDARFYENEFSPLTKDDFMNCPDYSYYGKILLPDGTISKPFHAKCPPVAPIVRDYEEYKSKNRNKNSRLTISEIEEEVDSRLEAFKLLRALE